MKSFDCDIVVVGGGPAGSTAARELANFGFSVVLLQKDLSFQKPCGGGVVLSAFDEFDLPKSLITKTIKKIRLISPKLQKVDVDISSHPLAIVDRLEFDSTLRELAKNSGANLIEAKAYKLQIEDSSIKVFAKNRQDEYLIRANYIIAADGVHSTIRKLHLNEKTDTILTLYTDINLPTIEHCEFYFGNMIAPKSYAWVFPHAHSLNIGICSNRNLGIQKSMQNFLKRLKIKTESKIKGYPIPNWGKELYYKDRVFYVGDSAAIVSPFTYEGIYYAMKSGHFAAQAIINKNPMLYKEYCQKSFVKKFKFLKYLQAIFLSNDFMAEKMIEFYKNPKFQNSVIGYWSGKKQAVGFWGAITKVFKYLFK